MAIVQKLNELGFDNAAVTGEAKGVTTVRVRTAKGWVYQKFTDESQADNWAKFHQPEMPE